MKLLNNFCNQHDITIIFNLYDENTKEMYKLFSQNEMLLTKVIEYKVLDEYK